MDRVRVVISDDSFDTDTREIRLVWSWEFSESFQEEITEALNQAVSFKNGFIHVDDDALPHWIEIEEVK